MQTEVGSNLFNQKVMHDFVSNTTILDEINLVFHIDTAIKASTVFIPVWSYCYRYMI